MQTLPIGPQFEPIDGQATLLERSRLSEKDFLQILVAQLRNQNPLDPQGDTDFITQLAQFDQLVSLNQLNATLSDLTGLSLLGQASGLLGREIAADIDGEEDPVIGLVRSVQLEGGTALLVVDGRLVPVEAVRAVREPLADAPSESG